MRLSGLLYRIKNSRLVRDTVLYTLTDAFGKAIGFIMLPILSYYLSPEDLGLATNFSVLTNISVLLAGSVMVNALPYFYYDQNKQQRKEFVSNLLLLCLFICFVLIAALVAFKHIIIEYLKLDVEVLFLGVVVSFAMLVQNTNLVLCRLEEKPLTFVVFQGAYIILHVVMMVILVIVLRRGGYGRIYADIISFVFMAFFHLRRLIRGGYVELKINFGYIKSLLRFGLPLLPHSLSFWIKGGADKIIITNFCGLYQNGLYSMALTMNSIYSLFSAALINAYVPNLQKRLSNLSDDNIDSEKRSIIKQNYVIILVYAGVALLAIAGSWIILNFLVDPRYSESFQFVPFLILGLWIYNIYHLSIQYIYRLKKTLALGMITFSGSIIQILLTWLFVRSYGVIGAAYSAVIGSLIISLSVFYYSNKTYPMPWFYWLKKG